MPSEGENEVIEGAAKVVGKFSDAERDFVRDRDDSQVAPPGVEEFIKRLRLEVGANFLRVGFEGLDQPPEVCQVFPCPEIPEIGVDKSVRLPLKAHGGR